MKKTKLAAILAIIAAALYALSVPLSKLLLAHIAPMMLASFLYIGAGAGLVLCAAFARLFGKRVITKPLTKHELPYTLAMIALDVAAPILLMIGLGKTSSANVSLLSSFEIVATSVIAYVIFKEAVSKLLWIAISLVTVAAILLGFEGASAFSFNIGSLFVIGACICWGFENNCTRMLSSKSSVQIVMIKGCFSGLGSLIVALIAQESFPALKWIFAAAALGFVSYGLSINFYIQAQEIIGAAKTSAFYSIAPFIGTALCMVLLSERPRLTFYIALVIMAAATLLMARDTIGAAFCRKRRE